MKECLDGLARITSKELAITHFVKNGILQNACSTSPRVDVDLEKSALMRTARLKSSTATSLKRMVTKVQTTIRLRIPGYGAAEVFIDFSEELRTHGNQSDVFNSRKILHVTLKLDTKILRSE